MSPNSRAIFPSESVDGNVVCRLEAGNGDLSFRQNRNGKRGIHGKRANLFAVGSKLGDEVVATIGDEDIALGVHIAILAEGDGGAASLVGDGSRWRSADDRKLFALGIEDGDANRRRSQHIVIAIGGVAYGAKARADRWEDAAWWQLDHHRSPGRQPRARRQPAETQRRLPDYQSILRMICSDYSGNRVVAWQISLNEGAGARWTWRGAGQPDCVGQHRRFR